MVNEANSTAGGQARRLGFLGTPHSTIGRARTRGRHERRARPDWRGSQRRAAKGSTGASSNEPQGRTEVETSQVRSLFSPERPTGGESLDGIHFRSHAGAALAENGMIRSDEGEERNE